jgi:hypothetical protein
LITWVNRNLKRAALSVTSSYLPFGNSLKRTIFAKMNIEFRPPVKKFTLFEGGKVAACISIDFDVTRPERFEANRHGTRRLIELGEKYGIPMTWAICGMTADQDPDTYELIRTSNVGHEIAVHTYSHIAVPEHDEATIRADIERCINVLRIPTRPKTFIFPWNKEGRHNLIRELGFVAFRGKSRAIGVPRKEYGMFNISPVVYMGAGSYRGSKVINKLMEICVKNRSVFHLWFHPWDLVRPTVEEFSSSTLEPVLSHMAELRDSGLLSIMTMGQLAEYCDKLELMRKDESLEILNK